MRLKLDAPRVLVWAALAAIFGLAAMPLEDPDFWFHLRVGQYIWETRAVPQADPFSYTASGNLWLTYSWLTEVGIYLLFVNFSYAGPIAFFAGIITAAYGLLYATLRGNGMGRTAAAVLTLWSAAAAAHTWGARPQMVSLALMAAVLYLLDLYKRRGSRWIWAVPGLMLLWANTHGGFLVGVAILVCYIVGERGERLLRRGEGVLAGPKLGPLVAVLALSVLALSLNPVGPRLLLAPLGTLHSAAPQAFVQEWQSPNFHLAQLKFYELMLLAPMVVLSLSRRWPAATDLLLLVGAAYLSLESARHIPFFALVAPPVMARHAAAFFKGGVAPSPAWWAQALNGALLGVVLISLAWRLAHSLPEAASLAVQRQHFPVDAVAFLKQQPLPGNMFNSYNWGGYLIGHLYPQYRVFIDGRAEVLYDEGLMRDYLEAYFVRPGWRRILEKHEVNYLVLEEGSPLAVLAAESQDWRLIYTDERAVVFLKNTPANAALLARLAR